MEWNGLRNACSVRRETRLSAAVSQPRTYRKGASEIDRLKSSFLNESGVQRSINETGPHIEPLCDKEDIFTVDGEVEIKTTMCDHASSSCDFLIVADGGKGPTLLGSPCDDRANPTRPAEGRAAVVTPDLEDSIETEAAELASFDSI